MKRFISILLAIVLAALCAVPSFAGYTPAKAQESQREKLPLVIIRGMDADDLIVDYGNGKTGPPVMPVNTSDIVKTLFKAAGTSLISLSADKGLDVVTGYAKKILGSMACDKTGTPICKAAIPTYPLAVSNYGNLLNSTDYSEGQIVKSSIDHFGADYTYYFAYDWRLNPFDNCGRIAALVDRALSDTGCSKVNLVCASLGGIQTLAYLTKYGYEKLNKIVFGSSAFCGSYFATDLFNGNLSTSPEVLYNALAGDPGNDEAAAFMLKALYKAGAFNGLSWFADSIINRLKAKIYNDVLVEEMGYIPAYWALVLPEGYDGAINYMFGDDLAGNAEFIALTAELQKLAAGRDALLLKAAAAGVGISVIAGYNSGSVPVGKWGGSNGDGTLETALMAGGAKAAKFGKTLGDNYTAADPACLSPDRIVDTSGCLFPASTWLIKDGPHVGCRAGSEYSGFLLWLLDFDGQPTVASNPEYPRFMQTNDNQDLFPLK